jgi:hypothetical protein
MGACRLRHQVDWFHSKGLRDPRYHYQAWISTPALDAAQVGQIDLRFECELLLGEHSFQAPSPDIFANDNAPIHSEIDGCLAYSL